MITWVSITTKLWSYCGRKPLSLITSINAPIKTTIKPRISIYWRDGSLVFWLLWQLTRDGRMGLGSDINDSHLRHCHHQCWQHPCNALKINSNLVNKYFKGETKMRWKRLATNTFAWLSRPWSSREENTRIASGFGAMLFRGFSALSKRVSSLGRHSIFNSTNNASAGINKKKMSSDNSIISNEDKMEGQGGMGRLKEDIILVIIIIILQAGEIRSQWRRQWMEVHIFQVIPSQIFLGLGRSWPWKILVLEDVGIFHLIVN